MPYYHIGYQFARKILNMPVYWLSIYFACIIKGRRNQYEASKGEGEANGEHVSGRRPIIMITRAYFCPYIQQTDKGAVFVTTFIFSLLYFYIYSILVCLPHLLNIILCKSTKIKNYSKNQYTN